MAKTSKSGKRLQPVRLIAFLAVVLYLGGFVHWSLRVTGQADLDSRTRAEAIVVLTGDAGRLAEAGRLLDEGYGDHLLVSGVHPSVTIEDMRGLTGLDPARFSCCVTMGRLAEDTLGNAVETAEWAEENGYKRLIIVTSDYHLPRSLLEMQKLMPEVDLVAAPVRTTPPWRAAGRLRLWILEYTKYLAVSLGQTFRGS